MSNINRDYLIVLNPKTSKVTVPELNYYIYDKYTANLFVNLVTVENGKVVNMVDADQYKLVLHVLKPTNEIQTVENIQVFNKEKALFQIELDAELTKNIGRYKCELLTIDKTDHIVQSAKFSYRVKKSIYNDLDVVTETPQYPIIITLLDKLQDIDKYEEERRANEVARVAAEKARVKDYTDLRQTVTTDIDTMQQKIDSFDGKVQEVDNAVTQMRTNITDYQTKKNTELDNYKTQKDTQINTAIKGMETTIDKYKTAKDTEINAKITQQDTKIDKAIALQNKNIQASTKALNDKLDAAVQDQNNTIAANNQAQNEVISDAVAAQNKTINTVVENDKKQNDRLDGLEYNDTVFITDIEHLQIKDTAHEDRMTAIEAVDVEQNNRLDAIEIKNDQQDGRLNDVEAKNKKQDLDLKCLFAESHSERITLDNEVGNSVFLQNSKQGFATIDELKGNTLVNCNKDTDKELILNGNIDTSGYSTVTTTEGVDGGKVDVALEGNTMVNVCDQEDPVAITKSYIVETGNHIALQGEYDGKCRPNIYGNTIVSWQKLNSFKGKQVTINGQYQTKSISTLNTTVADKLYFRIKFTVDEMNTTSPELMVYTQYPAGYSVDVKLFKDCTVGKIEEVSTIREHEQARADQKYMMLTIGMYAKMPEDVPEGGTVCKYTVHDYVIYNLTQLFGAGKEPEQEWCDNNLPYLEGMQSSFEDKLITDEKDAHNGKYKVDYKVTGKNLLDESKGVMNSSMGSKTICIKVRPNTSYTYSSSVYKGSIAIYELASIVDNDTDVSNLQNVAIKNLGLTDEDSFTVSGSTNYIFMNYDGESKVQIEEGAKATTYEPYKEYIKTLYLNSPLLEGDTIEDINGKATHVHRYGKVVLDGSNDEKWIDNAGEGDTINGHSIYTSVNIYSNGECMCDKLPVYNSSKEVENLTDFVVLYNNGLVVVNVKGATTIKEVESWLQSNPITLISKLKTPTYETISNDSILCDSYVNGHLDVDSVVPIDKVVFKNTGGIELKYIYPSSNYTVQFESDNVGKIDVVSLSGCVVNNIYVNKGINKIDITTKDTIPDLWLTILGIGFNMSKIVVTPKVQQPFGYFKGMKSVGECEGNKIEILSQNKNLINFTIDNIYNTDPSCTIKQEEDGATSIKASYNSPYWLKEGFFVEKGEKYSITIVGKKSSSEYSAMSFGGKNLNYYNSVDRWLVVAETSGNCITTIDNYGTYKTTATAKNTGYITRFFIHDSSGRNIYTIKNIQIEKADTPTDIVPYNSNKKEILMNEPLRGLPNGTKDKYVIIDGKWYIERNCGVDNQLQIRNWLRYDLDEEYPNVVGFYMNKDDMKSISALQCDKFKCLNTDAFPGKLTRNDEFLCGVERNIPYFKISIYRNKLETLDVYGFKKWLSENNVTIVYPLKTPTYEPIDYNPFEVYSDTTHISNNSNIPCNMVVRNSGYNCILKPNTTYTVSSNNGLSTVSTKDSIGDSILRFYNKDTSKTTKMNNVLVLEGDYITGNPPIPAFFKGMESAFEQELVTDEKDEHYGKYKVNVKATNPDNSQQNNITFYLKEPLRGVGDVKDKVYVKEDKVVVERNCSSVTFDGSEGAEWKQYKDVNSRLSNVIGFFTEVADIEYRNNIKNILCNCLLTAPYNEKDEGGCKLGGSPHVHIYVPRVELKTQDLDGFKQWLQQNPVTVVYQLVTPTYEEVEYFDLKLFVEIFKDTTIIYNSNIPVTSTINYTFSVPIVEQVNTLSKDVTAVQESANTVMTLASIMEDEVNK